MEKWKSGKVSVGHGNVEALENRCVPLFSCSVVRKWNVENCKSGKVKVENGSVEKWNNGKVKVEHCKWKNGNVNVEHVKMENNITSEKAGKITAVMVTAGQKVLQNEVMIELE